MATRTSRGSARRQSSPSHYLGATTLLLLSSTLLISQSDALPPWFPPPSMCQSSHAPAAPSDAGPAPPLPLLPKQYSMKVEANIIQKGWTTEVEEHYDSINERASIGLTFNGSTTVSIFNFKVGERYDIYPNGSCTAARASIDYFGFVKMKQARGERPAMATMSEVFKFGAGFNQTFVGKSVVRGIQVNHWTSCQEWKRIGAKFQLDYYFADPNFYTASGGEQIPVRAVLNGSANNVGMMHEALKGSHRFEHIYDFFSVRPGPPLNEDVFQVPPGVVCKGRQDTKPMPVLPDSFEMSMESIIPESGMHPKPTYLRYDWPNKLLETGVRMVVPQGFSWARKAGGKQQGAGPGQTGGGASGFAPPTGPMGGGGGDDDAMTLMSISTVQDYSAGVIYVLDKMNMSCTAHAMPKDAFAVGMAHGVNLLHVASRQRTNPGQMGFSYQGQTNLRRMLVDVWAEEAHGITQELYFLATRDESIVVRQSPTPGSSQPFPDQRAPDSRPRATRSPAPYPVLVGMYIKNRTAAENGSSLTEIFKDVFKPDAMRWTGLSPSSPSPLGPDPGAGAAHAHHMSRMTGDQLAFGMQLERMLEQRLKHKLVHIYNYRPLHTESSNFQVSLCYPDDQVSQMMLVVRSNYDQDVIQNFAAFSNNLREALAKAAAVSLLQISNLVPMPVAHGAHMANLTIVTFSLLGRPLPSALNQLALLQAKQNLAAAVTSRGVVFTVEYPTQSKAFMVDKSLYFPDYDRVSGNDAFPPSGAAGHGGGGGEGHPSTPSFPGKRGGGGGGGSGGGASLPLGGSGDGSNNNDGYSGGAVAGIAIATMLLGAAGALGGAYVFYRNRRRGDSSVPYQMTS